MGERASGRWGGGTVANLLGLKAKRILLMRIKYSTDDFTSLKYSGKTKTLNVSSVSRTSPIRKSGMFGKERHISRNLSYRKGNCN